MWIARQAITCYLPKHPCQCSWRHPIHQELYCRMLTRAVPHLHNHYNNIEMSFSIIYTGKKACLWCPWWMEEQVHISIRNRECNWRTVFQCYSTSEHIKWACLIIKEKKLSLCFCHYRLELFKQHLELTPRWRSKEVFDIFDMKTWDKFNQQTIIQPSYLLLTCVTLQ